MKLVRLVRVGLPLAIIATMALTAALFEARSSPKAAAQESGAQFSHSIHIPLVKSDSPDVDETLIAPARAAVAAQHGVAVENLSILNVARANYPVSGNTAYAFKMLDTVTGDMYGVSLDASGATVDAAQLEAAEAAAYRARYGVYEPQLADMLAAGAVPEALPIIIWLKEPEYIGPKRPTPDARTTLSEADINAIYATVDAQRAAHVAQVTAPVTARLAGMGLPALSDAYAPVVYTRLDAAALRTIGEWSEIDTIYIDRDDNEPDMGVAGSTIGAPTVWSRGIIGAGVRVAVIESNGRAATNPYMSFTQDTTYACASADSHATAVAGVVRSTFSSGRGIGFGVTLRVGGSCGGNGSQLHNRSTAAADWGARALNLSWGHEANLVPDASDRFYDDMVVTRWRTVVKSAGNQGASGCNAGTNGNITSPGLGYNVLTVGNFDDRGTSSWTDDVMAACSSWRDPLSPMGDREKPEVTAPGTSITMLSKASPWNNYTASGTSFSAPMVTGMAALLMERDSYLTFWPEGVKAVAMVSAINDIEGSDRLSEKDGAGGISADRADDIARVYSGTWGAMNNYTCSTNSSLIVANLYLYAGVRTRAAIVWATPTSYSQYASQPSADLDMQIVNSAGTSVVASSASWDNTYEIVDFTPSATGTYKLRVIRNRCSVAPNLLAWAWRRGS